MHHINESYNGTIYAIAGNIRESTEQISLSEVQNAVAGNESDQKLVRGLRFDHKRLHVFRKPNRRKTPFTLKRF